MRGVPLPCFCLYPTLLQCTGFIGTFTVFNFLPEVGYASPSGSESKGITGLRRYRLIPDWGPARRTHAADASVTDRGELPTATPRTAVRILTHEILPDTNREIPHPFVMRNIISKNSHLATGHTLPIFTLQKTSSGSTPSRQLTLTAAIAVPSGIVPQASGSIPQVAQN